MMAQMRFGFLASSFFGSALTVDGQAEKSLLDRIVLASRSHQNLLPTEPACEHAADKQLVIAVSIGSLSLVLDTPVL
jgi:hypothetical protein